MSNIIKLDDTRIKFELQSASGEKEDIVIFYDNTDANNDAMRERVQAVQEKYANISDDQELGEKHVKELFSAVLSEEDYKRVYREYPQHLLVFKALVQILNELRAHNIKALESTIDIFEDLERGRAQSKAKQHAKSKKRKK